MRVLVLCAAIVLAIPSPIYAQDVGSEKTRAWCMEALAHVSSQQPIKLPVPELKQLLVLAHTYRPVHDTLNCVFSFEHNGERIYLHTLKAQGILFAVRLKVAEMGATPIGPLTSGQ